MKRALGIIGALAAVVGCTGPSGPQGMQGMQGVPGGQGGQGPQGNPGMPAMITPSVSAVNPPYAFLGRTVDLTIAGNGTSWSSATTVAFADTNVKVNKVTAASASGLIVNVTVGAAAMLAPTDVTITDGANMEVYKGGFTVKEPLLVTVDQMGGVPQGGQAILHVEMLDTTTPFDANTTTITLSSKDLTVLGTPAPTDFAVDVQVEADVLATVGTVDLTVSSGPTGSAITSPAAKAFSIAARTPTMLSPTAPATGMIMTQDDTALFELVPADASQRFVQFTIGSMSGFVAGVAIPKDGKYADALAPGFGLLYGEGTMSTDPIYLVIQDGLDPNTFGPGMTPADLKVTTFESTCTAVAETAETAAANNDAYKTAQAVATLPALVNATLGYGTVTPNADVDTFKITVPAGKTTIHAATGGDALTDTVIDILDSTGTSINGPSSDADYQEDYSATGLTAGTYYVQVSASQQGFFDPKHKTYQLFVEVK